MSEHESNHESNHDSGQHESDPSSEWWPEQVAFSDAVTPQPGDSPEKAAERHALRVRLHRDDLLRQVAKMHRLVETYTAQARRLREERNAALDEVDALRAHLDEAHPTTTPAPTRTAPTTTAPTRTAPTPTEAVMTAQPAAKSTPKRVQVTRAALGEIVADALAEQIAAHAPARRQGAVLMSLKEAGQARARLVGEQGERRSRPGVLGGFEVRGADGKTVRVPDLNLRELTRGEEAPLFAVRPYEAASALMGEPPVRPGATWAQLAGAHTTLALLGIDARRGAEQPTPEQPTPAPVVTVAAPAVVEAAVAPVLDEAVVIADVEAAERAAKKARKAAKKAAKAAALVEPVVYDVLAALEPSARAKATTLMQVMGWSAEQAAARVGA